MPENVTRFRAVQMIYRPPRSMPARHATTFRFAAAALILSGAALAEPRPKVLVMGSDAGPPPEGFVEALSIQLARGMSVEQAGAVRGSLQERLKNVGRPLAEHHAQVGVWVERVDSPGGAPEFLVYVVTPRRDRVLVEVVRLPGPESPETERALALKVSEVLEAVLSPGRGPDVVAPVRAEPEATAAGSQSPSASTRWAAVAEAGLTGASAGNAAYDPQVGAALGLGARVHRGHVAGEALLTGGWSNGAHSERQGARVETDELALGIALRVLHGTESVAVGVDAEVGARFVRADGTAPDGRTGRSTKRVPTLGLGPEVRVNLSPNFALRGAGTLDYALVRQSFSVGGQVVSDLGRVRGTGFIGVVATLP